MWWYFFCYVLPDRGKMFFSFVMNVGLISEETSGSIKPHIVTMPFKLRFIKCKCCLIEAESIFLLTWKNNVFVITASYRRNHHKTNPLEREKATPSTLFSSPIAKLSYNFYFFIFPLFLRLFSILIALYIHCHWWRFMAGVMRIDPITLLVHFCVPDPSPSCASLLLIFGMMKCSSSLFCS